MAARFDCAVNDYLHSSAVVEVYTSGAAPEIPEDEYEQISQSTFKWPETQPAAEASTTRDATEAPPTQTIAGAVEPEEEPTEPGASTGAGDASIGVPCTTSSSLEGQVPDVPDLPPLYSEPVLPVKTSITGPPPAAPLAEPAPSSTGASVAATWLGSLTPREEEREKG